MPKSFIAIALAAILWFYTWYPTGGSLDITGGLGAPARCLAGFVMGVLIYRYRSGVERLNGYTLSAVQIGSLIWIVAVMTTKVHDSLVIPAFVVLIASTWTDRGVVARQLGRRTMRKLGEISFAVYISHILIIGMLNFVWERTARKVIASAPVERTAFIIASYLAVVGLSFLIYRRFEHPVRAYLTRRLNARHGSVHGVAMV